MEKVGQIEFKDLTLPVYNDLDDPMFAVTDIAQMLDCREIDIRKMLGQKKYTEFISERGLYAVLSSSDFPMCIIWRGVIFDELVKARKEKGLNIVEQFDEWSDLADTLYWDEEKACLMRSFTVSGGDVEQIPYEY